MDYQFTPISTRSKAAGLFVSLLVLLALNGAGVVGCASYSTAQNRPVNLQEESKKPILTSSLLGPDGLSEQAIQKILSSRMVLPKSVSVAVVRLDARGDGLEFRPVNNESIDALFNGLKASPRVRSVSSVPEALLGKPVTLQSIRTAGVLVQADLVVVLKAVAAGDWRYRLLDNDQAKAHVIIESFVLDTRTNIVPFTALTTETSEVTKQSSDYSIYETQMRAQIEGENRAYKKIVADLNTFLASQAKK